MALNFPSAPSANTTYTYSGKSWTYNGNAWALTSNTLNTSIVPESGNLYFTNARSRAAISVTGSGSYDSVNGIITITQSSNYGDSNVALLGYATNANVALKANIADLKTANVAELTNLYFTNARATTAVTNSSLSNITVAGNAVFSGTMTTGNIIPSGNNIQGLGSSTNRFKDLFLSGNTIYLGDVLLKTSANTFQVADPGGGVLFNAVDGSGFSVSTTYTFPGSAGNVDYGDFTSTTDSFGVSTSYVYSLMEPAGRSVTTDLGTL